MNLPLVHAMLQHRTCSAALQYPELIRHAVLQRMALSHSPSQATRKGMEKTGKRRCNVGDGLTRFTKLTRQTATGNAADDHRARVTLIHPMKNYEKREQKTASTLFRILVVSEQCIALLAGSGGLGQQAAQNGDV